MSKRVTKASKFEGAKPGWVVKTGEEGLGYYKDSGAQRLQLSLDLALRPMRTVPAACIELDDLVLASPQGQRQTQPEARGLVASGRAASGPPAVNREQLASGAVGGKVSAFCTGIDYVPVPHHPQQAPF